MSSAPPATVLSLLQNFGSLEVLEDRADHPFAATYEQSTAVLEDLIQASHQLSHSLAIYSSASVANPKLVSILRQHGSLLQSSRTSERTLSRSIDVLRKRSTMNYGEDIPLDRTLLVDWCISQLEAWGSSVGMEAFKDGRGDHVVVVLGGKVLVVDVDFNVDRTDGHLPRLNVVAVKTSYATPNGVSDSSTTDGVYTVESLLADSIRAFCNEVQKDEALRQPQEAARLGRSVVDHFRDLMTLDSYAQSKEWGGIRWFTDVQQVAVETEKMAQAEAAGIALSLSLPLAPLDIFLARSHTLPLPYLTSPSISFLVYISARTYYSLLRTSPSTPSASPESNPLSIDLPISIIRQRILTHPRPSGMTIATLTLCSNAKPTFDPNAAPMHDFSTRPVFTVQQPAEIIFAQSIQTMRTPATDSSERVSSHIWFLDFTDGGKHPGLVVTQSRMMEIGLVINPFSAMDPSMAMGMMSFNTRSWVDLLLNPSSSMGSDRYTAEYRSPNNLHPPLQLHLKAPEEPGFFLERIPIRTLKQIWGVLEIVREQCWLNEILTGIQWTPQGPASDTIQPVEPEEATEDELQAVLSGNVTPQRIPVNVYLPSQGPSSTDFLFGHLLDPLLHVQRPKIFMASPERPPISGLVGIAVVFDETRPRGVSVTIHGGALGAELKQDVLEEVCRRGGTLSLPGRVWASSHS